MLKLLSAGAVAVLVIVTPAAARCPDGADAAHFVAGGGLCLAMHAFGVEGARPGGRLVVVLHGDVSSGGPARYHIGPGYDDGEGRTSGGSHNGRRDHYTAANNAAIAGAIAALRQRYRASRVVIVGHSGGAAQAAVVAPRAGASGVVLASCPCDIPRWRASRSGPWPRSQSPLAFAASMPRATRVVAVTGGSDPNTAPALARDYVAALTARGVGARFEEVPGAGHEWGAVSGAALAAARGMLN
jgi:predicted esterase